MAIGRQLGNLVAGVAVSGLSSLMGGCPRVDLGTGSLPALDELTGTRPSIVYEDDLQLPLDERKPDADGFIPGVYGFSVNPKEGQKATEDITPLRSADGREPPVNFEVSYSKDTGNNITGGQIILKDNEVPFVDGTRFYADLSATTYVFAGYGEQTKLEFTYVHNRPGADNSLSSTVGELEDQVGEITTTVGNLTGQVSQNIGDIQYVREDLETHVGTPVNQAHPAAEQPIEDPDRFYNDFICGNDPRDSWTSNDNCEIPGQIYLENSWVDITTEDGTSTQTLTPGQNYFAVFGMTHVLEDALQTRGGAIPPFCLDETGESQCASIVDGEPFPRTVSGGTERVIPFQLYVVIGCKKDEIIEASVRFEGIGKFVASATYTHAP